MRRIFAGWALAQIFFADASAAATLTVDCREIRQYSPEEGNYFYYKVMESDGAAEAQRLWGAYHGLRGRCGRNANARATVSVSPELAELARAYR
jgi:hypothetical protein